MPPRPQPTIPSQTTTIPLPYRIFFLYLDPLICLSGIYLSYFDQAAFITNGVPSCLKTSPASMSVNENGIKDRGLGLDLDLQVDPQVSHFVRSVGAYSVGILVLQLGLLHGFKDARGGLNVRIWRILQLSILTIDLLLLYGVYLASPSAFLTPASWDTGDWTNNGILGFVAVVRIAFLLGVGF